MLNNKIILITGGTGSFGRMCTKIILGRFKPQKLIILSRDELKQFEMALVFPMEQYENFLFFIGAMFVPLFGVVLTDYFLIRSRQLNIDEIYKEGGEYWYSKGFNITAIVSWAIGFIVYEIIAIMKYSIGGSLPSLIAAGLVYYLITQLTARKGEMGVGPSQ